jgi:tRNA (cytidine/uridine-2'-O-)-methyltransferase
MRLALFQPDIPQNLGAAIRLTACLGVDLHVIEPCAFPLSDRAIRRAAMDYGSAGVVVRHDAWTGFLADMRAEGARILLFTTKAAEPVHRFAYRADDVLLFGRESAGVPDEVHAAADARLIIPIRSETRSLNVISAAAIGIGAALGRVDGFPAS